MNAIKKLKDCDPKKQLGSGLQQTILQLKDYKQQKIEEQVQKYPTSVNNQEPINQINSKITSTGKINSSNLDSRLISEMIPETSRLTPRNEGDCNYGEPVDENLEFKYQKLLDVLEGNDSTNKLGFCQQKIDYLLMISNRLSISFYDLLNLLPSRSLACLFRDYRLQEDVFVSIILASSSGINQPNKVFRDEIIDIQNKIKVDNEYYKAHCEENNESDPNIVFGYTDYYDQEENTPEANTKIFFSKCIIPYVLHRIIDFSQDISSQIINILGSIHNGSSSSQSINSSLSQSSQDSYDNTKSNSSQTSSNTQTSQNNSYKEILQEFYQQLGFFMEKIYRKHGDKAEIILQYLQNHYREQIPDKFPSNLLSYDELKKDKIVLYRLAMSGTKKLLFYYLQNKYIVNKYTGNCIFDFKKKPIFLDYYKKFITPVEQNQAESQEDIIFRISANLENYCKELQTSQNKIYALRNSIALIRFLSPFIDTFYNQFNTSASYKYMLRAVCWRAVRFILFIHDGSLSYVALTFLIFRFDELFSERSLLYQEHDRFLQLLLAFLYLYRNRQDKNFQHSQVNAFKLIKKLMRKISTKSQSHFPSKKKINILQTPANSNADLQISKIRQYWNLNYNYAPLDDFMQKEVNGQQVLDIEKKFQSIEKELKQIQEQPQVDEQVLLILAYLKNLLLKESQESQNRMSKSQIQELKEKGLFDQYKEKLQQKASVKQIKSQLYMHLLNLTKLIDTKKIVAKTNSSMNVLIKLKQELLIDCLGLIGPAQQQVQEFQSQEINPINLSILDLKEKIKGFLNLNIFNTDIPLVCLCVCKEYVENKFTGKRKKLNERMHNKSYNSKNEVIKSEENNEGDEGEEEPENQQKKMKENNYNQNNQPQIINQNHQQQAKHPFNLMEWLADLIIKMKKQDDMIKIIEGCIELMSNSDLGEFLTPYILFKYLNSTENSHLEITPVINKILSEGHHTHKLNITKTLITLDTWFKQELKEEKQQNYDPFKPQSIMHTDSAKNRFIRNFAFIKQGIQTQVYCKALVEMSEHKKAIHQLELELEQQDIQLLTMTNPLEIQNLKKIRTDYIYQLYNIYREINEDFKNIDGFEMMKKLQLDESEIKKYQDLNLKQKSDGLCPEIYEDVVNKPFRDEESQKRLINQLSKQIPDFSSENQDFAFQQYLRCICWGMQKILCFEKNNSYDNMYLLLKSAIQKLKYAFSLQLVNAKTCYDSKFSVLVKIQVLVNVETILKIQTFFKDYSKQINEVGQNQNLQFQQSTFSLDESQPDFILKLIPLAPDTEIRQMNGSGMIPRLKFNQILKICMNNILQIINSMKLVQLSYDQEYYLRMVYNYMICILFNQYSEFRQAYITSLFRLSQYLYNKGKYQESITVMKRAKAIWKQKKETFNTSEIYMLQAKIEKKLGNIKKAIHKLQKFDGIETKIKRITYKYQHNFQIFSETLIHGEFVTLMASQKENEKLYFKYAKFIDENELISDNPNEKEIDQKLKTIQLYLYASKYGHQYIHQSLSRAIRLIVELFSDIQNLSQKKANFPKARFDKIIKFFQCQKQNNKKQQLKLVGDICKDIEVYKITNVVNQLTSHISTTHTQCAELFIELLARVGAEFPRQSVWWLLPLIYMYELTPPNVQIQREPYTQERAGQILKRIKIFNQSSYDIITNVQNFYYNLLNFAIKTPEVSLSIQSIFLILIFNHLYIFRLLTQFTKINNTKQSSMMKLEGYLQNQAVLSSLQLILPKKEYIFPQMPEKNQQVGKDYNPYHPEPVFMVKLQSNVKIMSSKQKPKLLSVECSDQKVRRFLIKSQAQNENIYEQRTSELISFLNLILVKEQLHLYEMPTYSIIRLNSQSCIVEWVDDTLTMKNILDNLWIEKKQKSQFFQLKIDGDKLSREEWNRQKTLPPVFQDFFNQRFLDSQSWYVSKDNYNNTYAAWCIFGYLLGLGDRHTDNILINKSSGEVIHIDYALIFGTGKQLNVPETIPFRLTKNMEFALGAFKSYGLFRKGLIDICLCFSKHLDDIIGFWDCFTNELEGNRKTNFNQLCNQIKKRIRMTNFKSTEEGIDSLIQISKDDYCLRDMYKGWWPHA